MVQLPSRGTCIVCEKYSRSVKFISVCSDCSLHGYDLDIYESIIGSYYKMISKYEPIVFFDNKHGSVRRRYLEHESKLEKREFTLENNNIDIGKILQEETTMRNYIIGDYLKELKPVTKLAHVKTAFAFKEYAKEVYPEDPISAIYFLKRVPGLRRKKNVDIEKLRNDFLDSAYLFERVCWIAGPVIMSYVDDVNVNVPFLNLFYA